MSIVVRHDDPNQAGYAALYALLQAAAQRKQQMAQDHVAQLADSLAPGLMQAQQQQPVPQAPPVQPSRDSGYDQRAAAFYAADARRNRTIYDPNKPYLELLGNVIKGDQAYNIAAMKQQAITSRGQMNATLKPLQDAYQFWSTRQVPDEVAAALAAKRAEYTPKQLDERNKILASIDEAQSSPTLTPEQKLQFITEQHRRRYEIDSQPSPTTPDKWTIPPQQQYEQGQVWHTMPDGTRIPLNAEVRADGVQHKVDGAWQLWYEGELKKREMQQKSEADALKQQMQQDTKARNEAYSERNKYKSELDKAEKAFNEANTEHSVAQAAVEKARADFERANVQSNQIAGEKSYQNLDPNDNSEGASKKRAAVEAAYQKSTKALEALHQALTNAEMAAKNVASREGDLNTTRERAQAAEAKFEALHQQPSAETQPQPSQMPAPQQPAPQQQAPPTQQPQPQSPPAAPTGSASHPSWKSMKERAALFPDGELGWRYVPDRDEVVLVTENPNGTVNEIHYKPVTTREQIQRLPKDTKFILPDGRTGTRQ